MCFVVRSFELLSYQGREEARDTVQRTLNLVQDWVLRASGHTIITHCTFSLKRFKGVFLKTRNKQANKTLPGSI